MNDKLKRIYLKNAMIGLINVLSSIIYESFTYLSKDEQKTLKSLNSMLEYVLRSVSKQIPKQQMKSLENKTDLDYRLWVESQLVKPQNYTLFEVEFKDLIKKYS